MNEFLLAVDRQPDRSLPGTWPGPEPQTGGSREPQGRFRGLGLTSLLFVLMVALWTTIVVNLIIQDLTSERRRDQIVVAFVGGAVATGLFLVTSGLAWFRAVRAVVADRRDPVPGGPVRRERDRLRGRGQAAGRWAAAAGLAGLCFAGPLVGAFRDVQVPDGFWPGLDWARLDAAVQEADELEGVLQETATRIGVDAEPKDATWSYCKTPNGSDGVYLDLGVLYHRGSVGDPSAVAGATAEHWESLGFSVISSSEDQQDGRAEASSPQGGRISISSTSRSTQLEGRTRCSMPR